MSTPLKNTTQGFSLVELLTILAVVGILSGIAFSAAQRAMQRQQVAEAASQVMQDIERLRSSAIKTSQDATLTLNPSNKNEYTLTYWNNGTNKITQTVKVANGATLDMEGATALAYTAPYGELAAPNRTVTVLPQNGNQNMKNIFYIVGVTGQVHR